MAVLPQQHAITDALGDVRDGVPGALDRLGARLALSEVG